jgi:predicted NBD/HSP70 family sugar kinase
MMLQPFSGDSSLLKSINKASLLKIIREDSPVSRADLSKRTKLTRATVSALVEELIQDFLVVEMGIGESSGGRKPVMLEINREAGYVFGIDLRATEILLLITNLQGEKIQKTKIPYNNSTNQEESLEQIIQIIEREREALPVSPLGLTGISIGIHGFVEYPSSQILFVPFFGWKQADWKGALEEKFQVAVYIENEANLAALGELESGTASQYTDLIYLSIGAGIGAGMILSGNIFRGIQGYAGEVGHTTIERDGKLCTCGNRGCWEMYASERAMADQLGLAYKPGITELIIDRLEKRDAAALAAVDEAGRCLGIGIANLINTFNPQLVVIGNQLGKYGKWMQPYIEDTMNKRFPWVKKETVDIRYSELEDEACAIGAAYLAIRNLMQIQL